MLHPGKNNQMAAHAMHMQGGAEQEKKWHSRSDIIFTYQVAPIFATSNLQTTVALRPTEADSVALTNSVKKTHWLRNVLEYLEVQKNELTPKKKTLDQ